MIVTFFVNTHLWYFILCEGEMINGFYCQYICVFNNKKHRQKVLLRNNSLIYNLQDSRKHFISLILLCFEQMSSPFINSEIPPLSRAYSDPHHSFLDLINLTRYLVTSKWLVQIFLLHFLQIKSVQLCASANAGDFLEKTPPPSPALPTRATKNITNWPRAKGMLWQVL